MKKVFLKKEDVETLKKELMELKTRLELVKDDLDQLENELGDEQRNSIFLRDAKTQIEKLLI